MTSGRPPTPEEEQSLAALAAVTDPVKQLELIEKRATWVFTSVGVVGTALAGFTLLGGAQPLATRSPWLAVTIIMMVVAALALAGSTLVLRVAEGNRTSPATATRFFGTYIPRRARFVQVAVVLLLLAIVLASVGSVLAFGDRARSSAELTWAASKDNPALSITVDLAGLDDTDRIEIIVTGSMALEGATGTDPDAPPGSSVGTAPGTSGAPAPGTIPPTPAISTTLYTASATPDAAGVIKVEGAVTIVESFATIRLEVRSRGQVIESAEVKPPASAHAALSADEVVARDMTSLQKFWTSRLAEQDAAAASSFITPKAVLFDSDNGQPPGCSGPIDARTVANDAYFCGSENFIAIDRRLVDTLGADANQHALDAVLAHEWGHVIQRTRKLALTPVATELHADCLAGVWAGAAEADHTQDKSKRSLAMAGLVQDDDDVADLSGHARIDAFDAGADFGLGACEQFAIAA